MKFLRRIPIAVVLGALVVLTIDALLDPYRAARPDDLRVALLDLLYASAAIGGIAGALRAPRGARTAPVLLAGAASLYAAGYILFLHVTWTQGGTFPTVSDVLWLSSYVVVFFVLARELRALTRGARRLYLDAAVNACVLVALAWVLVVSPALEAAGSYERFAAGTSSYMICDFAMLGMLMAVATARGFRVRPHTVKLLAAYALFAVGDTIYARETITGNYLSGTILDPVWVSGPLLIAWAAWSDWSRRVSRANRSVRAAAVSPLLVVVSLLAITTAGGLSLTGVLLVLSVSFVCLRLVLSLRSNDGLLRTAAAAEEKYRELVETSRDLIWSIDAEGRVTFVNPAARAVLGREPDELIGRPFTDLIASEVRSRASDAFGDVLGGRQIDHYRTVVEGPDGSQRTLLVSAAPRVGPDGEIAGTTGTASDITAMIDAEVERARLQQRAAELERMEALGRLSGGIAHDFNNLTAIILNYADFLRDRLPDDQAAEDLGEIVTAAERAADLARQLLVFSSQQPGDREWVDADKALLTTASLLRRTLGEDVELEVRAVGTPVFVELGPGEVDQILMNLALNARDALPEGGRLRIALERPATDRAVITVSDDGVGMEPDVAARIFEPFYTTKASGTGLGLATVHGIVSRAGGEIRVDSQPGQGTRVRIELPGSSESLAEPQPRRGPAPEAGSPAARHRVLVVEDEPALRSIVVRTLAAAGMEVLSAGDGEEALAIAANEPLDLVLSDVIMPGLSGPETVKRIQRLRPGISVLYMSGYSGEALDRAGVGGTRAQVIRKPFTPPDLLRAVDGVLTRIPDTAR